MKKLSYIRIIGALTIILVVSGKSLLVAQSYQGLEAVKLVNAVNGDSMAIDAKSSGPLVVIIFTSNFCPYSRIYEERIIKMHREYGNRDVEIVLVNPNQGPDDSLDEMKKKAAVAGYNFPYLKDSDQVLTSIMGATRTPEAFLLKPSNRSFELVYRGAIDDNPQAANDVEYAYLKDAIDTALRGQSVENANVRVTGCIIKR
jgi:thiol-disulfide isomerase/thioredoxin